MSDMNHLYRAYAAVHDSEVKENLTKVRDEISEMTLTQLTNADLYEIAEEVLEEIFAKDTDVIAAEQLIESVFRKASEGGYSPVRVDKLERLGEAFVCAFNRVKERSIRVAVESYTDYRQAKERRERMHDLSGLDRSNEKLHKALVAEDRIVVKTGLQRMLTLEASYGNPAAKEEKLRKDNKLFGSPKKKARFTVGPEDLKYGTEAGKRFKAGNPNYKMREAASYETVKKGEVLSALKREKPGKRKKPLTTDEKDKIADKVVKDKGDVSKSDDRYAYEEVDIFKGLLESGKFTEEEIKAIVWEGYQRNPEEGERKERAAAKKDEAIPGQASRRMPPRGDKKREEFEKWYAANVR